MATKIPLNFFKRVSNAVTTTDQPIYTCPEERAGIIISAYATNITDTVQTINVKLSTDNVVSSQFTIVSALPILPNDAVNIAINKIVLAEQDVFIVSAQNNDAVNITLSILESINTP